MTKTTTILRTSFVQVCSLLCTILFFVGCSDSRPKVVKTTQKEVIKDPNIWAEIMEISPEGVVTLRGALKYGQMSKDNSTWENYRAYVHKDYPFTSGPMIWKEFGHSLPYKLDGLAKVGDRAQIYHVEETRHYNTGEVYTETVEVKVRSFSAKRHEELSATTPPVTVTK